MRMNASKVSVIGAGLVGSSTAFSLLTQGVCDEILLVDINQERAHGERRDLRDGIDYRGRNVKVAVGDYKDCGDADIVVILSLIHIYILIGSLSQCGCANSRMSPTIRSPSRSTFKTVS